MNRWKFHRNTSRLSLVLASLLTLIIIVITGVSSYAITPDGAYIGKIQGTGLTIGAGESRDRKPATLQQKLRQNTILYVPGGNKPWAHLGFFQDAPLDSSGLLVKAGPSPIISEWSFPCSARGRFTIAWKKGSDRGCEDGVKVQSSSKKGWLPNNNLQASGKLLAQAEDEVTLVPTPGESIIQTADSAAGISIDVLVGDVRVKSAKNPEGRPVKAGERYDYPQDTITPFDPNTILNSPEMQEFLNPNNWSSPDIPERIAKGFSEQLGEMQRAVSQLPQRRASQSTQTQPITTQPTQSNNWILEFPRYNVMNGICDNGRPEITTLVLTSSSFRGQIPWVWNGQQGYATINGTVAGKNVQLNITPPSFAVGGFSTILNGSINEQGEFIGTTRVQNGDYCTGKSAYFRLRPDSSAIPTPSNNGVNLNGNWTFNFGWFSLASDGTCKALPEAGPYQGPITITQNGSQLNISPSGPVPMTNGNVSGNQFESRGQTPMRWVGTISSDGKKISGSGICGSLNMPFTMTR